MKDMNSLDHVGTNIRSIRRRQHLSQVELARRLDMRPGPVNNIELGRNLPSAPVLHKLSQVLQVPIDAFFHPAVRVEGATGEVAAPSASYLASGGARQPDALLPQIVPARTPEEIAALSPEMFRIAGALADGFLALEDLCGAVKTAELPLWIPFEQTETGLSELCGRVRRLLGISEAVIFDYLELFENAGLRVVFSPLPDGNESLSCHDVENANAFFFISSEGATPERQLFRLGYELGRLYVHAHERYHTGAPPPPGKDRRGKPFTQDRAARRFAALLLMPESALRATVRQLGIAPSEWTLGLLFRVKHRYGVSAEAMVYRLKELNLISIRLVNEFRSAIHEFYEQNQHAEPDASRRVLSPNGRLGDLMLIAGGKGKQSAEVRALAARFATHRLPGLPTKTLENARERAGGVIS